MGDGHPPPSRIDTDPVPTLRLVNPEQHGPDTVARVLARTVLYSHIKRSLDKERRATGVSTTAVCCRLEDLFLLLERDAVDTLVFDDSVSEQERIYVSGWARIFKPGVLCESRKAFESRLSGHVA